MRSIRRRAGWSTVAKKSGSQTATRSTGICSRANQTRTLGRDALFDQDALEQQRDDLDRRPLDRRRGRLLQRLLALVQLLQQRRRADRDACAVGRRRLPPGVGRRSAAPRRSPRSGAATAAPARARCRRSRAAGGRPGGSAGRAPPRPGRCRAPGRRRASSAASPRRLRSRRRSGCRAAAWNSELGRRHAGRRAEAAAAARHRPRVAVVRAPDERPQVDLRQHVAAAAASDWSRGRPLRRTATSSSWITGCSSAPGIEAERRREPRAGDDARQHVRPQDVVGVELVAALEQIMRERRSVNSHEARSIIASARRELRISRSIVSSSTRLRFRSPDAPWTGSSPGRDCATVPVMSAARRSVDHAVAARPEGALQHPASARDA